MCAVELREIEFKVMVYRIKLRVTQSFAGLILPAPPAAQIKSGELWEKTGDLITAVSVISSS